MQTQLKDQADNVINNFFGTEEEPAERDTSQPTILLSSFEGCKGLSAGHVFIVGLNNGSMPKIAADGTIDDIEVSKFIVSLTRTRKCCYLLSNRWMFAPGDRLEKSWFLSIIPGEYIDSKGFLRTKDI